MVSFSCHSCGKNIEASDRIGRKEECDCGADLHCCLNCRFYDPASYNECKEPSAERVLDKDRANFCDYFEAGGSGQGEKKKEDLLAAAEALFKK